MKKHILFASLVLSPCTSLMATTPVSAGQKLVNEINKLVALPQYAGVASADIPLIQKLMQDCETEDLNLQTEVDTGKTGTITNQPKKIKSGTGLMGAVQKNRVDVVELYLGRDDIDVNLQGSIDMQKEIKEEYLDGGSYLPSNPINEINHVTAFMLAVSEKNPKTIKLLLKVPNINVNVQLQEKAESGKKKKGKTPLILAVTNKDEVTVGLLVKRDDIDLTLTYEGGTALDRAKERKEHGGVSDDDKEVFGRIEKLLMKAEKKRDTERAAAENIDYVKVPLLILGVPGLLYYIVQFSRKKSKKSR